MPALKVTTCPHDDGTVLLLEGEIDIATEDQFHAAAVGAVEAEPHGRVVLDCQDLNFIDSSGLRVLIQTHKSAKEHYGHVLIAAPNARVAQILRVTAIDSRIPVFPSVADALAAPLETATPG
ncbi:anti-sigma B factor antagonist [Murinocardiopsis flavida]|uniref:Anti-sigma factor antagonist n=1 Tax=Murinocardiopsis flavida TaxID=645275 RepID=A0A2P8DMV3_9ACTN|nr:STAS domain-containing protein [Murinocardiopsis flavida]PSK98550.1 anti-sigma B factor antagonist [Murinocardiopsis flavida]